MSTQNDLLDFKVGRLFFFFLTHSTADIFSLKVIEVLPGLYPGCVLLVNTEIPIC